MFLFLRGLSLWQYSKDNRSVTKAKVITVNGTQHTHSMIRSNKNEDEVFLHVTAKDNWIFTASDYFVICMIL